ncbi:NAD(P)H-binding protein [Minwuia thermotolerans]|uniref:NAD(P)-binding domain-containing protein n=1 Tax=Minwuia thermotolerans TaxID=2056226 RepID=A0A2M9FVQ5_9PROT|nr:NAD(P)H-binding protein [Minwuia thermotolerans]PJK27534.1 hypothetical protein CVT23_21720 [Minwuia thermotolerans]
MTRTILIIGATGGAGRAVADAALARGHDVRALQRRPEAAELDRRIEIRRGDAMNAADVAEAARGADFIFHGANPPGYRHWDRLVEPMAMNAAMAAKAAGARLLLPGNVYNFGPDQFPLIHEDAPQNPISAKGAVRKAMEQAVKASGARVTILHAGDYFGVQAPASWFSNVMAKPGRTPRRIYWPGDRASGHAFAYLPDYAEAFMRLIEQEDRMEDVEDLNFAGHYLDPGIRLAEIAAHAAGLESRKIKAFPWWAVRLAAPFVPLCRELLEMRYLWFTDVRLDNTRLEALIGPEPRTAIDAAVEETMGRMGCLPHGGTWSAAEPSLFSG